MSYDPNKKIRSMPFLNKENDPKKEHWIEVPLIDEMTEYIKVCIKDEISSIHNYKVQFTQTEIQGMTTPSLAIQLYYDEDYRRVYIKYDIDRYTKLTSKDWIMVYRRINSRIINIFEEFFYVECYILGAPNYYNDPRIPQGVYESDIYLPVDCITIWRTFDEKTKFISNHNQVVSDKLNFLHFGGDPNKIIEFTKKVKDINLKYDFKLKNKDDVPKAFDEYKILYKEYFGKDLKEAQYIDNPNMKFIYFNAFYGYE